MTLDDSAAGQTGPGPRRPGPALVAALIPIAIGGLLGYKVAYAFSVGDLSVLGGALALFILASLIALAGVVGVVALARPEGGARGTGRLALVAAGLLAVGGLAGYGLTPVLGLGYHRPVTISVSGAATLRLQDGAFVGRASAPATCESMPDRQVVGSVTAANLGELSSSTIGATVLFLSEDGPAVRIELWIDGADLSEGEAQPFWNGPAATSDMTPSGSSARAAFDAVLSGPLKPGDPAPQGWPARLSGGITWSCPGWPEPG